MKTGRWLVVPGVAVALVGSAAEVTLEEALELASRNNRAVRSARAAEAEAEARLDEARALRWPSIEIRQRLTRLDQSTVDRANAAAEGLSQLIGFDIPPFVYRESYRTEAELQLALWTSGALRAGIDAERRGLEAAAADAASSRRQSLSAVASRFFAAATARELIRARESAAVRADRRLEDAERRLGLGLTTREEVLRWRVEAQRAQADLAEARAGRLVADVELADAVGVPAAGLGSPRMPRQEAVDRILVWAVDLEPEEVVARGTEALERLPEVRAARARTESASALTRAARAASRPRLDAALTYGWLENDTLELDEFSDWSAALLVTVPVDVRGELAARTRAALARTEAARVGADDVLASLRIELARAAADLAASSSRVRAARRAVTEARERRKLLGRRREVGLADLLDLIDADTSLVTSEVDLVRARGELLAAVARLELVWPDAEPPGGGLIR